MFLFLGLTKGLAILPQGSQEPLMVTERDGRPQEDPWHRCTGKQIHGM